MIDISVTKSPTSLHVQPANNLLYNIIKLTGSNPTEQRHKPISLNTEAQKTETRLLIEKRGDKYFMIFRNSCLNTLPELKESYKEARFYTVIGP